MIRYRNISYGRKRGAPRFHHAYGVAKVGDPHLIDENHAFITVALDVFHRGGGKRIWQRCESVAVFSPGTRGFPEPDGAESDADWEGIASTGARGVFRKAGLAYLEEGARHHLGGGVLILERNDPIAICCPEGCEHAICGVHGKSVVPCLQKLGHNLFERLEVADHFIAVQCVRFQNELHLARVTVGELAFVGMLGEHVAVLDFKRAADSVGHENGCQALRFSF